MHFEFGMHPEPHCQRDVYFAVTEPHESLSQDIPPRATLPPTLKILNLYRTRLDHLRALPSLTSLSFTSTQLYIEISSILSASETLLTHLSDTGSRRKCQGPLRLSPAAHFPALTSLSLAVFYVITTDAAADVLNSLLARHANQLTQLTFTTTDASLVPQVALLPFPNLRTLE